MRYISIFFIVIATSLVAGFLWWQQPHHRIPIPQPKLPHALPDDARFAEIKKYWTPILTSRFEKVGLTYGNPIYIRIFKQSHEMEIWVKSDTEYKLYKTYPICRFSGKLGPKLKEGDRQAPEGFYAVSEKTMKPDSSNHLAFNIGFPNTFDQGLGRTGSFLMVHGQCTSIGCYAMTDKGIEEIYTIADAALEHGQKRFQVHAFPFRMSDKNMKKYAGNKWIGFWQNLKQGYDYFERTKMPPEIGVKDKKYVVASKTQ